MSLDVGIVGLPNVGKSTLFKCITSVRAEAANYPFCTIEPNIGLVEVPDERMERLSELFHPEKKINCVLRMVDIAGLVEGASKGEGLGNQFLENIRQTDAIIHLVRCFKDDNVIHVRGQVNPQDDIKVIHSELILADLERVEKRADKIKKSSKGDKTAGKMLKSIEELSEWLQNGKMASQFECPDELIAIYQEMNLITAKPFFFVMNVAEDELLEETPEQKVVQEIAENMGVRALKICCSIEAEIAEMDSDEKTVFLQELGIPEPGLNLIIREGFTLLDQITFFTAGKKEVRSWNIQRGLKCPQAAGKIHSDMERGFIRAEVYNFDDINELKSEPSVKEAGRMRVEGKDYFVNDGDIMHIRFNV